MRLERVYVLPTGKDDDETDSLSLSLSHKAVNDARVYVADGAGLAGLV